MKNEVLLAILKDLETAIENAENAHGNTDLGLSALEGVYSLWYTF